MKNAAAIRNQIEGSLSSRVPGALTLPARSSPQQTPCGVDAIDNLLHGGLPAGVITEFVGAECSGRTTMALAFVAAITQAGGVCAWIDASDALAPESAAACGVDLQRLLWVRCGAERQTAADNVECETGDVRPSGSIAVKAPSQPRHTGGGSPHPRSEGRDMPGAIGALMMAHGGGLYDRQVRREKKTIGTPGAPNRPVSVPVKQREEQVNSDRLPARRGDNLAIVPKCSEPQRRAVLNAPPNGLLQAARPNLRNPAAAQVSPWQALDQALRATDLLLQGGGFRTIVLDMASVPAEYVWKIPLATWFRFRAACDRSRISLVLLTQHACARSSAELVVRLVSGRFEAEERVMTGIRYQAEIERNREYENHARVVSIRKPPQSERHGGWKSEAPWAREM